MEPSSQDQRETPVDADAEIGNPNDAPDRNQGVDNPNSIQAERQHPPSSPDAKVDDGAATHEKEATEPMQPEDQAQAEEEQYGPGFPKKMEVVVLALVRVTQELDSDWLTELPKGTIVTVVEIVGRRARISHPFPGWLSIRTSDGQTILTEPDGTVRVGARIIYKDFHKKVSLRGTVIEKDDRRSLHYVQFQDGRKDWLNLNCKEVEILSTGRGEEMTAQASTAAKAGMNYFADEWTPSTVSSSRHASSAAGGGGRSALEVGGSPPHPNSSNRMESSNGYGPGRMPNGSSHGRHGYENEYPGMQPRSRRGVVDRGGRVVDPRYPPSYPRPSRDMDPNYYGHGGREAGPSGRWVGRHGHDAGPPGLQPGQPHASGGGHREEFYNYEQYGGPPRRPPEADDADPYSGAYPPAGNDPMQRGGQGIPPAPPTEEATVPRTNVKGFIVLRGLPGAGKTTLAKKLASRAPESRICTEDRYHWTSGEDGVGEYKFKREVLFFARDWCNKEVKNSIQKRVDLVILDNCNARISMYEDLINFAVRHKYRFRIIEFIATPELVDRYAARSLKGFPREVYLKLLKLWERDPRAELINPCFDDGEAQPPVPVPAPSHGPSTMGVGGAPSGPPSAMSHRSGHVGRDGASSGYYNPMEVSPPRGHQPPMMSGPPVGHGHGHGHAPHGPPPHAHGMRHRGHYDNGDQGDYGHHYY